MLTAVVAVLAGLAAGLVAGRRPPPELLPATPAAGRRVRAWAAGLAAGVLMALTGRWVAGGPGVALLVAGDAALAATALGARRHPGMVLVAAGLLANLAVVAADGGMPVRDLPPGAVAAGHHHGLGPGDHLTGLADDLRVPALGVTFSAGDVVAGLGGAVAAFGWLQPAPGRRRPRRSPAAGPGPA